MKKLLLLVVLILIPTSVFAFDDSLLGGPQWSFELKGGKFTPALDNWAYYYGSNDMPEYAMSLAYKLHRNIEVGVSGGVIDGKGQATAPLHGSLSGSVAYHLYPIDLFVLFRGVFSETQLIVPYVGGGFTRVYYREQIEGQGDVRGKTDGYHARGGFQLLLDAFDMDAANNMYRDYGVYHTYLFVETEYIRAKVKSVSADLGGTAWMVGLLFEY